MDADRWRRLSPLLDALLELEPAVRRASLASTREEDPGLADELEALLALEDPIRVEIQRLENETDGRRIVISGCPGL